MPTYDFSCGACHHTYEANVDVKLRDTRIRCAQCGRKAATRVAKAYPAALVFKGPGFHCNDYPKESR